MSNVNPDSSNSSRFYLRQVLEQFSETLEHGCRVLDAGAGPAMYRETFKNVRYETADRHPSSTYVCDLHDLPLQDSEFDAIISTQTLEHTQEPKRVLQELFRVLKPGSPILLTAPFFHKEHLQPYDFYRFTSFGMKYLFETVGFEIEKMEWLEGFFGTIGYAMKTISAELAKCNVKGIDPENEKKINMAKGLLQKLGSFFNSLDMLHKVTDSGFPKNFVVLARKPGL
jgi:SAM-dependent methyltransferase